VCALPEIAELNIGHFIMGEAIYDGLPQVMKRMRAAMTRGRMQAGDEPPPSRP
jgi:pyridoxine 5-phosphate synthase